jgi:flagella basal body P-ring formation protein FlgA
MSRIAADRLVWVRLATLVAAIALALAAAAGAAPSGRTAADLVRAAVEARLGPDASVEVRAIAGVPSDQLFREVRIDPMARAGRPIRCRLLAEDGASVQATAILSITAERAIARRSIERGETFADADIEASRLVVEDAPMQRIVGVLAVRNARARRSVAAGTLIGPADVATRRAIEPGDAVTAVATIGDVEVRATFLAADGGNAGDRIRLVNPDTHRYVRGRVVHEKLVEVTDER